jgi:hypothetical protein
MVWLVGLVRCGAVRLAGTLGPYRFESYGAVYARISQFASGLRAVGLEAGARLALYSVNRAEWLIAEQAGLCHAMLTVPLYDTLGTWWGCCAGAGLCCAVLCFGLRVEGGEQG